MIFYGPSTFFGRYEKFSELSEKEQIGRISPGEVFPKQRNIHFQLVNINQLGRDFEFDIFGQKII